MNRPRPIRELTFALVAAAAAGVAMAADGATPTVKTYRNKPQEAPLDFVVDPYYRTQVPVYLLPVSAGKRCQDATDKDVTKVPPYTHFRLSPDSRTSDAESWRVFIYSIPNEYKVPEDKIQATYFDGPFLICRTGKFSVQDDLIRRSGGFDTGILVVPFKVRRGSIFGDATLGPYLSYQVDRVGILASAGLTQIATVPTGSQTVKNETGLTAALGVKYRIKSDLEVACVIGVDHLSGDVGRNWQYQNKVWWSFAIGFNFSK